MLRRRMMMGQGGGEVDYSQQYLTFTAVGGQSNFKYTDGYGSNALSYSLDGGTTWTALAANTNSPNIQDGASIMWKASGIGIGRNGGIKFVAVNSYGFTVSGNIMSLLHGDNFVGQTTLTVNNQFTDLFYGCTSLLDASNLILPATTLTQNCYYDMFRGCTNLVNAPVLPAPTLALGCYAYMFYLCSSLRYIKCLATDISATNCLSSWVNGVASTGTFVKAASMSSWPSGASGIPSGWTVIDAT